MELITFGAKGLKVYGPKILNSLPYHIKNSTTLEVFETIIKDWDGA